MESGAGGTGSNELDNVLKETSASSDWDRETSTYESDPL